MAWGFPAPWVRNDHYHIVMAAVGGDLFVNGDISQWQTALLSYEEVVKLKAAGKKKKTATSASKEETLIELDAWYLKVLKFLLKFM